LCTVERWFIRMTIHLMLADVLEKNTHVNCCCCCSILYDICNISHMKVTLVTKACFDISCLSLFWDLFLDKYCHTKTNCTILSPIIRSLNFSKVKCQRPLTAVPEMEPIWIFDDRYRFHLWAVHHCLILHTIKKNKETH
jgi:hypothetical protein